MKQSPWTVARTAVLATLAFGACGTGFPRPARAEVTLSVAKDQPYGLYIAAGAQDPNDLDYVIGTTADNPIRLDSHGAQARLNQTGSGIRLFYALGNEVSYERVIDTFGTSDPKRIGPTALRLIIGGTNGEAVGTPVLLTLNSVYTGETTIPGFCYQALNFNDYATTTSLTFTNFKVGDSFNYQAAMSRGYDVSFQSTLSVAPVRVGGEPTAAPEPAPLLLLLLAAVAAGAVSLPRPKNGRIAVVLLALLTGGAAASHAQATPGAGAVREIPLRWPGAKTAMPGMPTMAAGMGSTHEIAWDRSRGGSGDVWVTGQNYDGIAKITPDGKVTYFSLPKGSGPHGMAFDRNGQLWVTFEFSGKVARLDANGKIAQEIDVCLHATGAKTPINTHPHGLAVGPDGQTLWFTGKKTGTVGRIAPGGAVTHIDLPTVGSVPIYITQGPDGAMWCTELVGNRIAQITTEGEVKEFTIPTPNSRPIALVLSPDKKFLWFSEEAGSNVARIGPSGVITEFPLPRPRRGSLLGGLCFDGTGCLWVECYDADIDGDTGETIRAESVEGGGANGGAAPDYLACFAGVPSASAAVPVTYHTVPSRRSVLHRVIPGPGGALWFTEMGENCVGILTGNAR